MVLGPARFTVLGPGLIRLEYSPQQAFEDRSSFFAVQRNTGAQTFKHWTDAEGWHLETASLHLRYRADDLPFHSGNLSIQVKAAPQAHWRPGLASSGNLGGTLRTLDNCEGPLDLGDGLLSRDGWYLKDDSSTVLYDDEAEPWVSPRAPGGLDWYFFGYGLDYPSALRAMIGLSGPIPLPPYWAFGSWYSRYWPYHSHEFLEIAEQYREHGFPLDVMVVDMDWHRQGWTGYSWNRELIPDPEALLRGLHERGLRVTLNLHPHAGVGPHEDAYPGFARALGQDPADGKTVPFDVTNRAFMREYFRLLLHPLEAQGVDFWWMDWQQGTTTAMPGLDPLTWLNDLHYRDRERPGNAAFGGPASPARRGMGFSRWSGWGDHRHPVQFSGDTHSNWEVLEFLPQFTATAGNVGVAYWSHDLGGHFPSGRQVDAELYLRWLQFGALSPVMRIHSAADPLNDRRPWLYGREFEDAARRAYALRASLVPYLYGAARQCFESGLPMLRPLYLHYPDQPQAYGAGHQYLLGQDLLVAGVARPGFGPRRVVHAQVWFPEGEWYDWETLERFAGPGETLVATPMEAFPLFIRGGAPVCTQEPGRARACDLDGPLVLRVLPGPAAERELYEDDGESVDYKSGAYRKTRMATRPLPGGAQLLLLGPSLGSFRGDQRRRPWQLELPVGTKVSAAEGVIQGQT
ncbi:MAG TPA: TIM-barrel domain-containing protein, partial [bacterium]|nr:TIM-barrel domain-containing protein [bacterium]